MKRRDGRAQASVVPLKEKDALEHLFRIDANLELVAIEEGCIIILIILVFESPSRLLCLRR